MIHTVFFYIDTTIIIHFSHKPSSRGKKRIRLSVVYNKKDRTPAPQFCLRIEQKFESMSSIFNQYEGDNEPMSDDFDFRPRAISDSDELYNDVSEEDVRKMAEALAPQMSELEDVLKDISAADDDVSNALELAKTTSKSLRDEDDEDLDDELRQLAMSEQALREELEFTQDINALLTPSKDEDDANDWQTATLIEIPENPVLVTPTKPSQLVSAKEEMRAPEVYTLQEHADHLRLRTEKTGGWYYCDMSRFLQADTEIECPDLIKDYALPIPFRKLKRMYTGLSYHPVESIKSTKELSTPAKFFASPPPKMPTGSTGTPGRIHPIADSTISPSTQATGAATSPRPPTARIEEEPLPVRTIAIRIRPDVLVGAVMDSIHHAFEVLPSNCVSHVLKRQGGHFRAGVYMTDKSLASVADAQLCTQKSGNLERRLVLRFYHVQDDPEAMLELGQAVHHSQVNRDSLEPSTPSFNFSTNKSSATRHMKEACSLIQRFMAAQQQGGAEKMDVAQQMSWLGLKKKAFATEKELKRAVAVHLKKNFKPCPSVREENKKATIATRKLTFPSLSGKDASLLDITWGLTTRIVEELDTRDCSYNTLETLPFGQFPALSSLDTHYCSQLRRLCRESMINSLLRAAKDLEDYAKGAEYNCAVCITLLQPMLKRYGLAPFEFPRTSKSLQEYPLDFIPPQISCPPWGQLVLEADNQIQAKTPSGAIDAKTAVKMVYNALTKQDDEEQAARLSRKNAQIMDRLVALQSHQRALVQTIRDAHVSEQAAKEAGIFLKHAQNAVNAGNAGYPRVLLPEVPLLIFKISQGASSSGTCFISTTQILFVSTYIPLVGSTRTTLFDLDQVTFQVDDKISPSLLNPFPNTMNILHARSNDVLFRFRPAINPSRLSRFLSVIQGFTNEEEHAEFSQAIDAIDAVQRDGEIRLANDREDDQLSV